MKNLNLIFLALASSTFFTFWSCQTPDENDVMQTEKNNKQENKAENVPLACGNVYALVLSGSSGSPVASGLTSHIYNVDLCPETIDYTFQSSINIGGVPVMGVTGLCDFPGISGKAIAVTGINSNFPQRLLNVDIATGLAVVMLSTSVPLQDIENDGNTGDFYAIRENSSQIMKVDILTGICTAFAPVGPTPQYNGLIIKGGFLFTISGNTSYICGSRRGDVFRYALPGTGSGYVAKNSYKSAVPAFTTEELGLFYDDCCGRNWVVGSSSNMISNNTDIIACTSNSATLLLDTTSTSQPHYSIYDFMLKP
ncbi:MULTISPECIES: hypothetical protein [Flavobacterium]|uniref:Lipoprotein n=1 Tax=Flavobacterium jumunjinense TaxID=998845 RepID=A0ABV5GS34_9FLAO|nr:MULTISPECIES: hypothetical protein [Flavobacterium]